MSQNIHSLWSPDIKATVLTPQTILRGQVQALALQTGGVLVAEIIEEREAGKVSLSLDLVAPALHGSRHRILKVSQGDELPYPAFVEAEVFRSQLSSRKHANSDHEFTDIVAEVLSSPRVLSLAQSLIARANEALATTGPVQ